MTTVKACPYCKMPVPPNAMKCGHCRADIGAAGVLKFILSLAVLAGFVFTAWIAYKIAMFFQPLF